MHFTPKRFKQRIHKQQYSTKVSNFDLVGDTVKFLQQYTMPMTKGVARQFLTVASKYSPPGTWKRKKNKESGEWETKWGLGKAGIAHYMYYCRIIDMRKAYNDYRKKKRTGSSEKVDKLYPKDIDMMKQGFKYKVITNKYRKHPQETKGWFKNINLARHAARIPLRGLAKYSWGSLLNNFTGNLIKQSRQSTPYTLDNKVGLYETELPDIFKKLAKESPGIVRYRWGFVKIFANDMVNGKWKMTIRNRLAEVQQYCMIAAKMGAKSAISYWFRMKNAWLSGNADKFQKFINFEMKKISIMRKH